MAALLPKYDLVACVLKRAKRFAKFPLRSATKTFCIAAAEAEKHSQETGERKKKKEKDVEKVLAYERYRANVQNTREAFRAEYEKAQARERRRLEELNRGSFSPVEQHKKAVEDIGKYNEKKEIARFVTF
jgi:biopolymer transport protein ExbB/TolQ